ncbi:MAG: hypothetical protein P8L16_01435 [Ilumatobacter sp.]|nr:hypothetical protein [Ilumatobacter sp.]
MPFYLLMRPDRSQRNSFSELFATVARSRQALTDDDAGWLGRLRVAEGGAACQSDCAMTGPNHDEVGDDDLDPWAPGGAMAHAPQSQRPDTEFKFRSIDAAAPPASGRSRAEANDLAPSGLGPTPTDAGGHRGRWLAGSALVMALAVGAVLVTADNDNGETQDTSGTSEQTSPSTDAADNLPAVTAPRSTPPPLLADVPAAESQVGGPAERLVLAAAPREFIVDLAPELATINPTEVVALGVSGLYEISLPSGRVRVTDIGFSTERAQAVANDQVAIVWPTPESRAQAIGIDGTVAVPEPAVDAVSWSPATNQMYLWTEQDNGAVATELSVRDLELRWQAAGWIDPTDGASPLIDLDGALLRQDTGGVYRVNSASTDLLTTGDVVSTGANHLLLRKCDATRSCELLTVDRNGEQRAWPVDVPPDVRPQLVGGLSPGGDALLFNRQRIAADVASDLGVLELTDGTSRSLRAPPGQELTAAWDTNGTGVVIADSELIYIDRFTGTATIVAAGLPTLRSVSTRRPAATPVCEILAISQPRFALMAAGGDTNTASPPASAVLNRLVAVLPAGLVGPAAPLINFVTGFVSPEVADSQTVANWPADVQAGLDALNSYAATECPLIVR